MKNLRIKIAIGSFNVELDGDSEDVISQLDEIKQNGLGQIAEQLLPIFGQNRQSDQVIHADDTIQSRQTALQLPHGSSSGQISMSLYDVALKMLPKYESEWILLYGYYTCVNGKQSFNRQDILDKYDESNRKKKSHIKNLSSSIQGAAKKGWISQQNDTDFIVTPDGHARISEIFQRTEATVKSRKAKKKESENV